MTRTEARRFYWRRHGHSLGNFRQGDDGLYRAVCKLGDCTGWMEWDPETESASFLDERCAVPTMRPAGHRPSHNRNTNLA